MWKWVYGGFITTAIKVSIPIWTVFNEMQHMKTYVHDNKIMRNFMRQGGGVIGPLPVFMYFSPSPHIYNCTIEYAHTHTHHYIYMTTGGVELRKNKQLLFHLLGRAKSRG
jgi:hypothetical protein